MNVFSYCHLCLMLSLPTIVFACDCLHCHACPPYWIQLVYAEPCSIIVLYVTVPVELVDTVTYARTSTLVTSNCVNTQQHPSWHATQAWRGRGGTGWECPRGLPIAPLQADPAHHVVQAGEVPHGHAEDHQPHLPPGAGSVGRNHTRGSTAPRAATEGAACNTSSPSTVSITWFASHYRGSPCPTTQGSREISPLTSAQRTGGSDVAASQPASGWPQGSTLTTFTSPPPPCMESWVSQPAFLPCGRSNRPVLTIHLSCIYSYLSPK